jgi:hypothetical protein
MENLPQKTSELSGIKSPSLSETSNQVPSIPPPQSNYSKPFDTSGNVGTPSKLPKFSGMIPAIKTGIPPLPRWINSTTTNAPSQKKP